MGYVITIHFFYLGFWGNEIRHHHTLSALFQPPGEWYKRPTYPTGSELPNDAVTFKVDL
jgi:hypothetical protein